MKIMVYCYYRSLRSLHYLEIPQLMNGLFAKRIVSLKYSQFWKHRLLLGAMESLRRFWAASFFA